MAAAALHFKRSFLLFDFCLIRHPEFFRLIGGPFHAEEQAYFFPEIRFLFIRMYIYQGSI